MSTSPNLDLALRLWPQVRDGGAVDDPAFLDALLASQGQPGAVGYEAGIRSTFACFKPDEVATFILPSGEQTRDDQDARLLAHILVTRVLLGAGLHIDRRVQRALADVHAIIWTPRGVLQASPLALATSLWLIALDPLQLSDQPLAIDWTPEAFQDAERWDLEYRLFSHYDIHQRALDWVAYASAAPGRIPGCSAWTVVEPLLRFDDQRAQIALGQFATLAARGEDEAPVPAAAMLDRARVEALLRAHLAAARS
ncbi:MAG: hypothetical protein EPO65_09035 [Dehalococcoidia bacterium]|nr:MAG: hypothetical protein EPO65_09035 [Dehalococcoidia bacterium]